MFNSFNSILLRGIHQKMAHYLSLLVSAQIDLIIEYLNGTYVKCYLRGVESYAYTSHGVIRKFQNK